MSGEYHVQAEKYEAMLYSTGSSAGVQLDSYSETEAGYGTKDLGGRVLYRGVRDVNGGSWLGLYR